MIKNYLALDLGASSGRAIIGELADSKLSLREIHRFNNGPIEKDGSLFWDFDSLLAEIKTGMKKAMSETGDIAGVGIDTWGVDYILLKKDGSFRLPYNYRDSRTDGIAEELWKTVPETELYSRTGIQFMQLNSLYQLIAHYRIHPEDFEDSVFLMMPDALTYMLSGEKVCEYTEASTSNLLDANRRAWDFELIQKLGLPTSIFPAIAAPGTLSGNLTEQICRELDCPPVPVYHIGSHDTASAVASVPANSDSNWAYISCGTWALLGAELDSPKLSEAARQASFTNEGGLDGKIRFLTNIMGTWLLQECQRVWNENGKNLNYETMSQMAKNTPSSGFLLNPNNQKFFAPGDMPANIVDYCKANGQGELSGTENILRCVYDSLALCFRAKLNEMQDLLETKLDRLHIVGGGVQDKFLMQLSADCVNMPVVAGPVEATSIGNVLGQAMAAGQVDSLASAREIVKNSFDVQEFQPDSTQKSAWDEASERFSKLP